MIRVLIARDSGYFGVEVLPVAAEVRALIPASPAYLADSIRRLAAGERIVRRDGWLH